MDRKSITVLFVCFVLLILWNPIVNKILPPTVLPPSTNTVGRATNQIAGGTNVVSPGIESPGSSVNNFTASLGPLVRSDAPEQTLVIENQSARYTFTSHGGGLKMVELKDYPATVTCDKEKNKATNNFASLNGPARIPSMTLVGDNGLQGDGVFTVRKTAENAVRAEKALTNGLRIIKDFQLSTNYLVKTSIRIENASGSPVTMPAQELVVGTATPIGHRDESLYLGIQWYNGSKAEDISEAWFANRTLGCIPGRPRTEFAAGSSNVVWASVHNQFFAMVAIPETSAPAIVGRRVELPPPTQEQLNADSRTFAHPVGYQAGLVYPAAVLQPNQSVEHRFDLYAGPKEYNTLARLGNKLDHVMKFGFFGFFAEMLLLSMNGIHHLFSLSYGVAIVVITVIIKLLFWPLTNASTKSMKRMSALQPQMKALQEKYKDDPRKMNMKMMEFMRENKVSPLGGCLPMLLQIPVFIGFYTMLQSAIELRGASFLWACDLSQPDTIAFIPGLHFPINPMPLLMGVTMIWQARLTPPAPGMDPVQQKIMRYMPLMFMVFLYNFSAGLTLYWTVQNLLTIAQMKLTKTSDNKPQAGGTAPAVTPKSPAPKKKK